MSPSLHDHGPFLSFDVMPPSSFFAKYSTSKWPAASTFLRSAWLHPCRKLSLTHFGVLPFFIWAIAFMTNRVEHTRRILFSLIADLTWPV